MVRDIGGGELGKGKGGEIRGIGDCERGRDRGKGI